VNIMVPQHGVIDEIIISITVYHNMQIGVTASEDPTPHDSIHGLIWPSILRKKVNRIFNNSHSIWSTLSNWYGRSVSSRWVIISW
jgi:hypothetical protein